MARIRIINATVVKTGTSANGRDWTLREIDATKLDGEPIDLKLKTFEDLQAGQEVDVEFEKQEHEKYGVSYMLKLKGSGGGGGGGGGQQQQSSNLGTAVDLLHQRVEHMTSRLGAIEGRLERLERPAPPDIPTDLPPAPTPVGADDDIPF